jgi:hypothetical protein
VRILYIILISLPVVTAGKRFSCLYMFERPLAQVRYLCLYFFFPNLFDDSFYTIHGPKSRGFSVTKACTLVHGQKPRRFFHSMLRCTMVRSVSSQERGQITVTLFLLLHHFFLPSSFERLSLLSWNKKQLFLSYSFYYDFSSQFFHSTEKQILILPFL